MLFFFLYLFSFNLVYQKISANEFLFREGFIKIISGDVGKHFYVIFDGSMNILEQSKQVISMDYDEYFKHLVYLEKSKHKYLIKRTIKLNEDIYPFDKHDLEKLSIENIYLRIKLFILLKSNPTLNILTASLENSNSNFQEVLGIIFPSQKTLNENSMKLLWSELNTKSQEINNNQYKYCETIEKQSITLLNYKRFLTLNSGKYF